MRYAFDQIRLAMAEKLIYCAVSLAPHDHPDSLAIAQAALHVFARKPSAKWRSDA